MQAFQAIPQSFAHGHHEIGINVAEACLHVPEMRSGTDQTERALHLHHSISQKVDRFKASLK